MTARTVRSTVLAVPLPVAFLEATAPFEDFAPATVSLSHYLTIPVGAIPRSPRGTGRLGGEPIVRGDWMPRCGTGFDSRPRLRPWFLPLVHGPLPPGG